MSHVWCLLVACSLSAWVKWVNVVRCNVVGSRILFVIFERSRSKLEPRGIKQGSPRTHMHEPHGDCIVPSLTKGVPASPASPLA